MKTVKQVAKICGVSVRTIQYYDKINLLSPSDKTDAGYRLYSDTDIAKLQQILFLKELGFRLKDIQAILNNSRLNNAMTFRRQKELLNAKRQYLDQLISVLEQLEKDDAPGDYARYVKSIKKRKRELNLIDKIKKAFVLVICFGTVAGGIYAFSKFQEPSSGTSIPADSLETEININQVDRLDTTKIDAKVQSIGNDELPPGAKTIIERIKIPNDIQKANLDVYFVKSDLSVDDYDKIGNYRASYGDQSRNVIVGFASGYAPLRDYRFADGQSSRIYDYDVVVYKYEDTYFAEFEAGNYYFDIETNGLSKSEFITLLASFFE